jgi:hypothetical protein
VRRPSSPPVASGPHFTATENNASCDITTSPAATLLLPFFEVDVTKPVADASNTIFTIVNVSRVPQIARVTIWTDYGYPTFWFNVFLTGFDVQSISMYDVVAHGMLPVTSSAAQPGNRSAANGGNPKIVSLEGCAALGGGVPDTTLAALRATLTSGAPAVSNGCSVGSSHLNATGYVTVDLVNSCSAISPLDPSYFSQVLAYDNVLTGDYEHVYPDRALGNFAGGSPLVHIKAIPEGGNVSTATPLPYTFYDRYTPRGGRRVDRRQPLPSTFAARFIQGGTGSFFTDVVFWREGSVSAASCASANAASPTTAIVRFDDVENPTAAVSMQGLMSASAIDTKSSFFPPMSGASLTGWIYLNLDNQAGYSVASNPFSSVRASQNWVVVRMKAEGRYGVDYDATQLANACASTSVVSAVPGQGSVK